MNGDGVPPVWLSDRQRFGVVPGLERTHALLAALGRPDARFDVVLVAGTNGKGSVSALLHAMLRAGGRRVGRFTSPHLERFGERVTIDFTPGDAAALAAALGRARAPVEATGATYFEALTAIALDAFALAGVEIAVLEVGMGGRWDATNATEPILSVVTSVDLDHTEVLGRTVETIALDKAGVARAGRPLLTGASGAALAVVRGEATRVGAKVWALDDVSWGATDLGWDGVRVRLPVPSATGSGVPWRLETHLLGAHQARNLALAGASAAALGLTEEASRAGAAEVAWPGRLEPLSARGRRWLLDGAHNPAAAHALAAAVRVLAPDGADVLVVGVNADKDVDGILDPLVAVAKRVVVTHAVTSARALEPTEIARRLAGIAPALTVDVRSDAESAVRRAEGVTRDGDLVLVAGSLFLVGEVRTLLRGARPESGRRWQ
ncbi:folylpolyglutamate synthase/dihydrofolate synthase family protein [soil metagenome]